MLLWQLAFSDTFVIKNIVQHLFAIGELHVTSGIQHVACNTAHA